MATTGKRTLKGKPGAVQRPARRRTPKRKQRQKAGGFKAWAAKGARRTRDNREFIDAILDTTNALIVVMDAAGRIRRFNRASEQASGLRAAEVIGTSALDRLVPDDEREAVRQVFEELRTGNHPNVSENHWQRPDGSRRLIAWSNTSLLNAAGEVQYVVATGIDVTEQRQAEQELYLRRREIIRLRRSHTVGALTTLLAHEMNQPLGAITSYAEASLSQLRQGRDDKKLNQNLMQIAEQAQRASRSLKSAGEVIARSLREEAPTDISAALRSACELVDALVRARGIRLAYGAEAKLPRARIPTIELVHILFNLLNNSVDALRDAGMHGGRISARIEYRADDGTVRIGVEDTGPGVNAELVERVFEPLYTTKTDGLGLGLSICRSVMEAHGGKVWAEPGPGGKFYVAIPTVP